MHGNTAVYIIYFGFKSIMSPYDALMHSMNSQSDIATFNTVIMKHGCVMICRQCIEYDAQCYQQQDYN